MIYATNPEWLATLRQPPEGEVWIMSEDGVMTASCKLGSLTDENGVPKLISEGLEEIQKKYCVNID